MDTSEFREASSTGGKVLAGFKIGTLIECSSSSSSNVLLVKGIGYYNVRINL